MRRRGFLQCITVSTIAAVLPWRALSGWAIDGEAAAPGARLLVRLAAHVPLGASLAIELQHKRQDGSQIASRHAEQPVSAGQKLELVTPYPYSDLVAGTYEVALTLRDERGHLLDRHVAGSYAIRRFRFSA